MITKFALSKLTVIGVSIVVFVALWSLVEALGWSGGATAQPAPLPAAPVVAAPSPTSPPPVIIRQTTVVRRIHVSTSGDGGARPVAADSPSAGSSAPAPQAPVAAAPPPQPQAPAPQAPAEVAQPVPAPVTSTGAS
ncbi:MAG: hypothetical protein WEE64_05400 [Dehalococcoidia bacterium]